MSEKFPQGDVDPKIEERIKGVKDAKDRKTADRAQQVQNGLDEERKTMSFVGDDKQAKKIGANSEGHIADVHTHTAETVGNREGEEIVSDDNRQDKKSVLQTREERVIGSAQEELRMFQEIDGQDVPVAEGVTPDHAERAVSSTLEDLKTQAAVSQERLRQVIRDMNSKK